MLSHLANLKCLSKYCFTIVVIIFLGFQNGWSQDSTVNLGKTNQWHFKVEPYLMLPNMNGSSGIASLPLVDIDANANDIFKRLKFGGMLYLEAANDKWSINSDLLFMNLEQGVTGDKVITGGSVNARQLGWELAGLRRVTPWLEFGAGGLLNGMEVNMKLDIKNIDGGTTAKSGSQSKTWVDPMLITRFSTTGNKKIFGQVRGEIGGFGIGSKFAWQAQAVAGYRFSKLFDMSIGYRAIGLDYENGESPKTFIYDVITYGAMIRFGFNF